MVLYGTKVLINLTLLNEVVIRHIVPYQEVGIYTGPYVIREGPAVNVTADPSVTY